MAYEPGYDAPAGVVPPRTAMVTGEVVVGNACAITDNLRRSPPGC